MPQHPLAEEVIPKPLAPNQRFPVVVFGADFKQPGMQVVSEGSGQFSLPGTRWAIQQDICPWFPPFQGLADAADQKSPNDRVGGGDLAKYVPNMSSTPPAGLKRAW